ARRCVDGPAGFERVVQRRRAVRFDGDDADAACVPRGDAADEPAAADGDEHRVEIGRLALELETQRPLTEQRLSLIERVDWQGARLGGPPLAGGNRVVVPIAADDEIDAVRTDLVD